MSIPHTDANSSSRITTSARLVLSARARVRVVERGQRAISRHPAEVIHQLARLDGDGHREVLRVVELLSLAPTHARSHCST